MSSIQVGLMSKFGNGSWEYCGQIWQMLLDSRSGAFPLKVATTPSGTDNPSVTVGLVSQFGMGQAEYRAQIWQMILDSRNGTVPFVVTNV